MKNKIILASASPRRKELLLQVGIDPEILPSRIEEVVTCIEPEEVVEELSLQKAQDVAGQYKDKAYVIGADTVVSIAGAILGKPRSKEDAIRMLTLLQGKVHQVYTGVTIICCGREGNVLETVTFSEKTDVWIYDMSADEITSYVESKEPMDKAGAYGIQGLFAAYIKGVCGDYNNVVGLPVGRVCRELKTMERKVLAND